MRSPGPPLLPPPEVAQLHYSAAADTTEGCWLHIPVLEGVSEQTDARVLLLLTTQADRAEVIDAHTADFVGMEVDHLGTHRDMYCHDSWSFLLGL